MADSIETIYESLRRIFEITDGANKKIRTFGMNEIPESITPDMIPCAVTYPTDLQVQYSEGGPVILFWSGQTDYHLTKDVKPANITYILPFFGRIFAACAQRILLTATATFALPQKTPQVMTFITYKDKFGEKDDHQGIVVRWELQQDVSGQYTIS